MKAPRVVCIGGGHGLSAALGAAIRITSAVTAIVTVADDGGSSGVLRKQLGMAPPGDLRMALAALAGDPDRAALLQYRFQEGELAGHPLGNLLIAAVADVEKDFVRAIEDVARLIDARGRVLPAAGAPLTLHATVDGLPLRGQVAIATSGGPIERIWVEPAGPATPDAIEAVGEADLVILGPGSLFTSVVAALVVGDLAKAVAGASRAIFVMNLREQPGETAHLNARAHVEALTAHCPGLRLAAVVAHNGKPAGPHPL
ncbi:MAG: uridine diphosphate-N-acetylglucosamine-binding protein YvcK, partial [Actinobacteria bacterium]|nr:uridine diphosphate-N-acetylglucosamine-binding protein YvcK [Actinomycetota bacterium]